MKYNVKTTFNYKIFEFLYKYYKPCKQFKCEGMPYYVSFNCVSRFSVIVANTREKPLKN
jgi:hypothetical protein